MEALEKRYTNYVTNDHRKKYGQFYTIDKIADFMVAWIIENNPLTIYDPAFGMGAFYRSVEKKNFKCDFIASEIDKVSYDFYCKNSNNINLQLTC